MCIRDRFATSPVRLKYDELPRRGSGADQAAVKTQSAIIAKHKLLVQGLLKLQANFAFAKEATEAALRLVAEGAGASQAHAFLNAGRAQ
eukprot:5564135-Alexandrium_andersonii.AAC.1